MLKTSINVRKVCIAFKNSLKNLPGLNLEKSHLIKSLFRLPKKNLGSFMQVSTVQHISSFNSFEDVYHQLSTIFQPLCNHEIFIKFNLPIHLVLVRQRAKSQKYFGLWALNWNLNHSNL